MCGDNDALDLLGGAKKAHPPDEILLRALRDLAAKGDHVGDTRHGPEVALDDPVFQGAQVARRVAVSLENVAVDFADGGGEGR